MEVGLLISGNLGLIILNELFASRHSISFVFTDFGSGGIIDACNQNNIPCFKGNPRNNKANIFLGDISTPDILLSVNYLFIIEDDVIAKTKGLSINIHGSLLPKYRGRTPHVWAIINGEKQTGITVHTIAKGCDEGDIVYQEIIPIEENETGYDVLNKFNNRYPNIVTKVISMVERNEIKTIPQENHKATYFGKRTPEDGLINWGWQKERIKNWIRALAYPYPGAFTFHNNRKFIFNECSFSDLGFFDTDKNGKILAITETMITVKTCNGAINLFRNNQEGESHLKSGEILI